jgi:hypothetical protein
MNERAKPLATTPSRDERLAEALRQNLKRRKAQARAQQDIERGVANEAGKDQSPSK